MHLLAAQPACPTKRLRANQEIGPRVDKTHRVLRILECSTQWPVFAPTASHFTDTRPAAGRRPCAPPAGSGRTGQVEQCQKYPA
jgi:hypothetical protein